MTRFASLERLTTLETGLKAGLGLRGLARTLNFGQIKRYSEILTV